MYNRRAVIPRSNRPYRSALSVASVRGAYNLARGVGRVAQSAARAVRNYKKSKQLQQKMKKNKQQKSAVVNNAGNPKYVSKRRMKPMTSKYTTVKTLAKQVKNLQCLTNASMGCLTYRNIAYTGTVTAENNRQNVVSINAINKGFYQLVLDQLRFYDPSNPATLITADGSLGLNDKSFCFETVVSSLTIRNNFRTPCYVSIYYCKNKSDTDEDPHTIWSNNVSDKVVSGQGIECPFIYPNDCEQLKEYWTLSKSTKKQLEPGETYQCSYVSPKFDYEPNTNESKDALYYRQQTHSFSWLVVVRGVLGHNTEEGEENRVGYIKSGIDCLVKNTTKVKYNAGASLDLIYCDYDENDHLNNIGIVSNKPPSQNINWSQDL